MSKNYVIEEQDGTLLAPMIREVKVRPTRALKKALRIKQHQDNIRKGTNKAAKAVGAVLGASAAAGPLIGFGISTLPTLAPGTVGGNFIGLMAEATLGGMAVDEATKAINKTVGNPAMNWGETVSSLVPLSIKDASPEWLKQSGQIVADMTNPGYTLGSHLINTLGKSIGTGLGNLSHRYSQRGRYTLNELLPYGYGDNIKQTFKKGLKALRASQIDPLYKDIPYFYNNKRPKWYNGSLGDEVRFQNGAVWAGVPEYEVPRTHILKNADNKTYRWSRRALETYRPARHSSDLLHLNQYSTINNTILNGGMIDADLYSTVGGEHSFYRVIGHNPNMVAWEMVDDQTLNPLWLITDPIKRLFPKYSKPYKFLHNFGGKDASWVLGYKPFTYKQGILVDKDANTLFFDPTNMKSKPY